MKNLVWLVMLLGMANTVATSSPTEKNREPIRPSPEKGIKKKSPVPEPIRYSLISSARRVVVGEEFSLKVSVRYFKVSSSSLFTELPVDNRLRVVFPSGFVQTGGDYQEDVSCQVNEKMPLKEWTIRGKFLSGEGVAQFTLIRRDGSLSESTWIGKDHVAVQVGKAGETAAGRESSVSGYSQCVESENTAVHSGGSYANSGASGGYAMWSYTVPTEYIDYTFTNVPSSGSYTFKLRYSTAENPTGSLVVNGGAPTSLPLPTTSTTSWYVYVEKSVTVNLIAGTNTIRVQGGTGGGFHQDRGCLESAACTPPGAPAASVSPSSVTAGQSVTLTATGCSGLVTWKNGSGGTSGTGTPLPLAVSSTTSYTATCTVSGCESGPSNGVTVTVVPSSSSVLANGCYRIKSKQTGNPITLVSGNVLEQRAADGTTKQLWSANQVGTGTYSFTVQDGSNLSITASSDGFGIQLSGTAYSGGSLQKWTLQNSGDGSYRISTPSGNTWDIRNYGADPALQLWGNTSESYYNYRLFTFESATCPNAGCTPPAAPTASVSPSSVTAGQSVTLTAAGCSGLVTWKNGSGGISGTGTPLTLAVSSTTTYTATCSVGTCVSGPSNGVTVTVVPSSSSVLANGCYRIKSKQTGNPITLVSGNVLEQRAADGTTKQLWSANQVGTGTYSFTVQDGSNLSITASSDGFGIQLSGTAYSGGSLQKWTLQNSGDGSYRISTPSGNTWDIRNYGADPALQLWGNTSESYYNYRLYTFEAATCPSAPVTSNCSNGISDGVTYCLESKSTYLSGNYSPWAKFGKFTNPYVKNAVVWDLISGQDVTYSLSDATEKLSNLGLRFVGIYGKKGVSSDRLTQFFSREPLENRYLYTCQKPCYEQTNPAMGEFFIDPNPGGYGVPWTLSDGSTFTPQNGEYKNWNIVYAWKNNSINGGYYDANFSLVRPNVEGHNTTGFPPYYERARFVWQNGKYRPASQGGTDPEYANMDLPTWLSHLSQCQISYDDKWYSPWKNNNRFAIGYEQETRGGFMTQDGMNNYQREPLFHMFTAFNGRRYRDFISATNSGGDVIFNGLPFALVYTDAMDPDPAIQAYQLADLGLADNGSVHTGVTTSGEPEYFRYIQNANQNIIIQFEDKDGNTRATTRPMRIESAFPLTGGYGPSQVWQVIPVGTSSLTIQIYNPYLSQFQSVNSLVDDALLGKFEYLQLYYEDMKKANLEGFPVQDQVYAYTTGSRGSQFNSELQITGQMPKELVHGLRFLGANYNYMQVVYNQLGLNGMRTADHFFAAQKRLNKYNNHFNDNKKAMIVEISLDGGATWTNQQPATWVSDNVLSPTSNGYNAKWIRNRKNAGQASPLVLVSYNAASNTTVVFEKVLYGNSMSYSFRFKKPDGTYATYLNRSITSQWKDSLMN